MTFPEYTGKFTVVIKANMDQTSGYLWGQIRVDMGKSGQLREIYAQIMVIKRVNTAKYR